MSEAKGDMGSAGASPPADLQEAWDVIVVGAGPAGSVMAHQLAARGAAVLLLDKAAFPRFKVCGCCINGAALAALEGIGLRDVMHRCGGIATHALDLCVAGPPRGSARIALRRGVAVSRSALDAALAGEAVAAGSMLLTAATARLSAARDGWRQVDVQYGGESRVIRSRIVVAADGLAGTLLRDEPAFQPHIHRQSRIGAAVTLPAEPGCDAFGTGVIWMTCGSGGYVGVVRLNDGELHCAAALDPDLVRRCGGPGPAAAHLLKQGGRPVLRGLSEARWRGTAKLMRRRAVEGEGLLVIGDAAGYVEPFTGEGMAWAVTSAIAAAPIALAAARGTDVRGKWTARYAALVRSRQRACRALAWGLRRPRLAGAAVRVLGLAPRLGRPVIGAIERPARRCTRAAGATA